MGDLSITIAELRNRAAGFYPTIGPFLSKRHIVKELGSPIWDDDNKIWFVAKVGKEIAGFSAVRIEKDHVVLCSSYVLPAWRKKGIYSRLTEERLKWIDQKYPGATIKSTATSITSEKLKKIGFEVVRTRGRYSEMIRGRK